MRKSTKILLSIFLLTCLTALAFFYFRPSTPLFVSSPGLYLVYKVVDGDTIEVQDPQLRIQKVRLVGINTPEVASGVTQEECFGQEASGKTKELLNNTQVKLEIDSSQNLVDKYGRLLRYVYRSDGLFVNQYLVENGYAFEYTYQGIPHKYQADFRQKQQSAHDNHLGLWDNSLCPNYFLPAK